MHTQEADTDMQSLHQWFLPPHIQDVNRRTSNLTALVKLDWTDAKRKKERKKKSMKDLLISTVSWNMLIIYSFQKHNNAKSSIWPQAQFNNLQHFFLGYGEGTIKNALLCSNESLRFWQFLLLLFLLFPLILTANTFEALRWSRMGAMNFPSSLWIRLLQEKSRGMRNPWGCSACVDSGEDDSVFFTARNMLKV